MDKGFVVTVVEKIKNWIVADIHSGRYQEGSRMPTRHQLMARYNVARATIDKVIVSLSEEGFITSSRGAGTFVQGLRKEEMLHVYFVVNTDRDDGLHSQTWTRMMEGLNQRINYSVLTHNEVESNQSAILKNKGSRIIWNRAALRSFSLICTFEKSGVRQLLINRPHSGYSYIATDTCSGIERVCEYISREDKDVTLGLLVPPMNPERPFVAEREIYFYENAVRTGLHVTKVLRSKDASHESMIRVVQEYFAGSDIPDYIFIPEITMVPYVLAIVRERKLRLGDDFGLVLTDWNQDLLGVPGLICLEQKWSVMFEKALEWVHADENWSKHQIFIMPDLKVVDDRGVEVKL